MPTANQNFFLDGNPVRAGDRFDDIPDGLDRLFDDDPEPEGD